MFDFIAQAAEPVITGLDVVKTVDAFYQDAWLKLIGVLVFFGALIGVVMPLIIQRIQSSSFDKAEKRIKDEIEQIKNKTQESIQGEVEGLRSTFGEIQKNIEKRIIKETRSNRAEFYSLLANTVSIDAKKVMIFFFHIHSAKEYALLENYEYVTEGLNQAISEKGIFSILTEKKGAKAKKLAEKIRTRCLERVDELRKILEIQGAKNRFSELLAKVDAFIKETVTVVDKPRTS